MYWLIIVNDWLLYFMYVWRLVWYWYSTKMCIICVLKGGIVGMRCDLIWLLARSWAVVMTFFCKGRRDKIAKPWISYTLCVGSTVVISINYHYRNVVFHVGCGITMWVMGVGSVTLERNGKENFPSVWAIWGRCWKVDLIQGF